jgi:ubiquinone/menaquinone biosynthesis C-methylase UbiE
MNSNNANASASNPAQATPERILQFAWGYTGTLILDTALRLGLFDLLDQSPKTVKELASATGASTRGLTSILNALVGFEFLTRKDGRYALSPDASAFLVSTKPGYHGMILQHTAGQLLPKWMQLPEVVRTGRPAMSVNSEAEGASFFAGFVESLFPLSYPAARQLAEHLQLAQLKSPVTVLDLAAGSGVWGIALAQASPQVRIRAVDWPDVLKVTERVAQRHGVGDRLTTSPGDLLQADFGKGNQIATLGHILHSEGAEKSRKLLRKTFEALAPGGTIAIMEFLVNDDRLGPPQALTFSVNMLVNTETGDTFSFEEISQWLREAGFENPRLLPGPGPSPLILATRPKA